MSPPKVRPFATTFAPIVPMCQRVHCPLVPITMALLLWLVSWKEHYSNRCHYTRNSGLPHPLERGQGLLPIGPEGLLLYHQLGFHPQGLGLSKLEGTINALPQFCENLFSPGPPSPAWDVALVLQSLTNQPYEPIREAEERFLAQKMLFLIALASAKQVGELHALSYRVSHSTDWKEVSFSFVPGFVAKTQDQSSFDPRFENFTVPALPKSSSSPNGRLLCPVRAVKHYLDRTARDAKRLFIAAGRTKKEVSKNTVSFWLRKVISLAYRLLGKPLPSPYPLARETRGIVPSLLFKKNCAVSQVLKAGTWRRHTTFTRHYLRDLSHKSLDTFHLGPVLEAQATV